MCNIVVALVLLLIAQSAAIAAPSLPSSWNVIAPFPVGTREVGVDVLNAFGGIFNIPIGDASASYPSDLIAGGHVKWTTVKTVKGAVDVTFNASTVDFDLINAWSPSATAWQGWAVGEFEVEEDGTFMVSCSRVSAEYFIDDKVFKGDYYSADLAIHPVTLTKGKHTFYVHLLNQGFSCQFFEPESTSLIGPTHPGEAYPALVPDVIIANATQQLASSHFAVSVTNMDTANFLTDVTVSVSSGVPFKLTKQYFPSLAPGQTRPIRFEMSLTSHIKCNETTKPYGSYKFNISISATGTSPIIHEVSLQCKLWPSQPYKFTFPDFDGAIQYAMLVAPKGDCKKAPGGSCPILYTFHGAAVIANTDAWTRAYSQQEYYWILFPTNRRNYGWDFQGPGRMNARQSLDYFTQNIPGVPQFALDSKQPDPNRLLYAGHSMGGHGCWSMSTKYPDKALGVAPAAGWISFPMYQPYFTRVGNSLASPFLQQILQSAISMDNTDFYTRNLAGLPLITRFGGKDTNVPPYHMRRMSRLVDQINSNATWVEVSEVPGQPHWFSGVVDGPVMQAFFDRNLKAKLPALPQKFVVTTMHTASSTGRGGIQVVQQVLPYRASFVEVTRNPLWELETQNVRRLGFNAIPTLDFPSKGIVLDGQTFDGRPALLPDSHFCNVDGKLWKICNGSSWTVAERSPATTGPLVQVIEAPFLIVIGTKGSKADTNTMLMWATFLANSWHYQIRSMVDIVLDTNLPTDFKAKNLLLFGGPSVNKVTDMLSDTGKLPVTFEDGSFSVNSRTFSTPKTGISFLTSWGGDHVAAILAGTDMDGLKKAITAFPRKSGHMVPDYAVYGPNWGWAGDGGLLAAGFWSNTWKYSQETGYVQFF